MKRPAMRLRPEGILTWLTLLGFLCYVITWLGYRSFYRQFNVSPETVGISYPSLIIPAAVTTAMLGVIVIGVAALAAPLVMPVSVRAARIVGPFGLFLFVVYIGWFVISGEARREPPQDGSAALPPRFFAGIIGVFGFLLLVAALYSITSKLVRKRLRRQRHIDNVKLLRRRIAAERSESKRQAIVHEYLASRRNERRQLASRQKDLQAAAPFILMLLVSLVAFPLANFVVYLSNAAEGAARDVLAGKPMFESTADVPASILLNVRAPRVEIVAVESQFRPLERQKLLYLGTKDGGYVLYDIAKKRALLIPSGAIALQISEVRS